jgi:hypothetical protein
MHNIHNSPFLTVFYSCFVLGHTVPMKIISRQHLSLRNSATCRFRKMLPNVSNKYHGSGNHRVLNYLASLRRTDVLVTFYDLWDLIFYIIIMPTATVSHFSSL